MNSRLMELIDVSTIETMAEQFYKLTNISHQLLDAEKQCVFSFGMNEIKRVNFQRLKSPFSYTINIWIFCCMVQKSEIFSCQKYFEMLSSLILDGAIKVFQSKNTTLLSRKEEELHTILQNMPVMAGQSHEKY